ncbi:MAG: helix-turn-helix domain-containing protein, partial [Pseudomonadota bacterium]
MATEQDDVIAEPQAAPPSSVGATLKAAREATGKELPEVASQLRIRLPYLAALEEGRHKDLPGGTYAVGFLRTYAEFLSLDGEEMVRRFKQEAAGDLDARAELVFPSPVSEGRIPGGALLFLGLVLAGAAYGGWYWLSSRDATVAEMVPPIPERLAAVKPMAEPAPAAAPEAKTEEAKTEEAKTEEV